MKPEVGLNFNNIYPCLQYVGFYLHCRKVGGEGGIMIHDLICDLKTILD